MLRVIKSATSVVADTTIDPSQCIDSTTTGTSYYDSFLNSNDLKYMEQHKNRTGKVEYMTPLEYYELCAKKVFKDTSVASLKNQRRGDSDNLTWLTNYLESGKKFQMPYANIADGGQEGLHRMMVLADIFGWDSEKFPVLVVDYVSEREEQANQAYKELRKCVENALDYKYEERNLPDYLIDQVQYELDKRSFEDESEYRVKFIDEDESCYSVTLEGFENEILVKIMKYQIQLREPDDLDDIDDLLSDEDLLDDDLDIEEFLAKLQNR